jgi:hypothetical protein
MTIVVTREPAIPAWPVRWPRWLRIIRGRMRLAIRRRRHRARVQDGLNQWQSRELGISQESTHSVRKAFFSAEAQMGMFR